MNSIFCFVFLSIALANGKKITVEVPQELATRFLKTTTGCVESLSVNPDYVTKILSGNLEDSELFRKFIYCMSKGLNYIDNEDKINKDVIMRLAINLKVKSEFEGAIDKCIEEKGSDTIETLFKFAKCFFENSSVVFKL